MLSDAQQRMADHQAGVKILTAKEREDLERKISLYSRKLETMQGQLDDREVERILKREQIRNERLRERRARHSEL